MSSEFSLRKKMTLGIKWVSFGQILIYILQLAVWAILARLLPPDNFGALSIAMVFSNLGVVFNELGMSSAVIQRKELGLRHTVTAFWICVIMGVIFLTAALLGSSLLAGFFKNNNIEHLVILFAFKYFIDSFGIIQEALLRRELAFKKLSFIDIVSNLIYGVSVVIMALKGVGILSVGWGYLAASLLRVSLLWIKGHLRPSFEFDTEGFKELFKFGKNILGFKILNFFVGNMDIVLIGKLLGSVQLGYYSLASNLVNFPRLKLSSIISTVAFSAFSKIQDDYNRLRQAYLRIVRYAAVVNFPLLAGLMFLSPQVVRLLYSSKWDAITLPLRILCIYGICFSITTFIGVIFDSTGNPGISFKFCAINLFGTAVSILIGFKYSLIGIIAALSLYSVIINIVGNLFVGYVIKMRLLEYLRSLMPAFAASIVMSCAIVLSFWVRNHVFMLPDVWFLCVTILISVFIYSLSLFFLSRQTFQEMKEIGCNLLR